MKVETKNVTGLYGESESFWKSKVAGDIKETSLYFKKKTREATRLKTFSYAYSDELSSKLLSVCNDSPSNLFCYMYTAMTTLIHRSNGAPKIALVVPTQLASKPSKCRNVVMPLIGENYLGRTFKDKLSDTKQLMKESYKHRNYPLNMLENACDTRIDELSDITLSISGFHSEDELMEAKHDINFKVITEEKRILIEVLYNSSAYDEAHLSRFLNYSSLVIDGTLADINIEVDAIDYLGEQERNKQLIAFNRTEKPLGTILTVQGAFQAQVKETPDQVALTFQNSSLTYSELDKISAFYAYKLSEQIKGTGRFVGIMTSRSLEMIIAILAALKSGNTYIPIDPEYPEDRVRAMVEDSGISTLLTTSDTYNRFGDHLERLNIDISDYEEASPRLDVESAPSDIAYMIYTSGSTGKPKGVMIENQSILNFSEAMKKAIDLNDYKTMLCITTLSFDIFILETLVPLINGLKVVITEGREDLDAKKLAGTIKKNGVDVVQSTPSRLSLLLQDERFSNALSKVKAVLSGGEALPEQLATEIKKNRTLRLFNMYGPTETTVWSLVKEVKDPFDFNIGKPILNTDVFILNDRNQLLPIGAEGEICIGGMGVSRGYFERDQLTKERFISSPFSKGKVIYKTGDVGAWTVDGEICFKGRRDEQVKVRGYRIELGEIEKAILSQFNLEAIKVVFKGNGQNNFLCAYYTAEEDVPSGEMRSKLEEKLPEYMIPSYLIKLDEMPYTNNGKISSKVLRDLPLELESELVSPRNKIEAELLKELTLILDMDKIGVTDNILEFGANSLNIMRFIQRIQSRFTIEYEDVIREPYISKIAQKAIPKEEHLKDRLRKLRNVISESTGADHAKPYDYSDEIQAYRERIKAEYEEINYFETKKYKNVLLLGATGYLGVNLLRDLLKSSQSKIHVIIRSENRSTAVERIKSTWNYYFDEDLEKYESQLQIYCGDLNRNDLGVTPSEYEILTRDIDCIVNAAANVSHYALYEDSYAANVGIVKNLIELCKVNSEKYLMHVSTTSVGSGDISGVRNKFFSEFDLDVGQVSGNNYIKTKLEAEKIVLNARHEGVKSTILRVGNLVFNSESGRCQKNIESNAFYQRIKSFLGIGIFPYSESKDLEFSFIDSVSSAVVKLMNVKQLENEVFHIYNHKGISYNQFAQYVQKGNVKVELANIIELLDFLIDNYDEPRFKSFIDVLLIHYNFSMQENGTSYCLTSEKTQYVLERLGFKWQDVNESHIYKMFKFANEIDFFKSATTAG